MTDRCVNDDYSCINLFIVLSHMWSSSQPESIAIYISAADTISDRPRLHNWIADQQLSFPGEKRLFHKVSWRLRSFAKIRWNACIVVRRLIAFVRLVPCQQNYRIFGWNYSHLQLPHMVAGLFSGSIIVEFELIKVKNLYLCSLTELRSVVQVICG